MNLLTTLVPIPMWLLYLLIFNSIVAIVLTLRGGSR